jgi:hypothetical protein
MSIETVKLKLIERTPERTTFMRMDICEFVYIYPEGPIRNGQLYPNTPYSLLDDNDRECWFMRVVKV